MPVAALDSSLAPTILRSGDKATWLPKLESLRVLDALMNASWRQTPALRRNQKAPPALGREVSA